MSAFVDVVYGVDCFECGFEYRTLSRSDAKEAAETHNDEHHTGPARGVRS